MTKPTSIINKTLLSAFAKHLLDKSEKADWTIPANSKAGSKSAPETEPEVLHYLTTPAAQRYVHAYALMQIMVKNSEKDLWTEVSLRNDLISYAKKYSLSDPANATAAANFIMQEFESFQAQSRSPVGHR